MRDQESTPSPSRRSVPKSVIAGLSAVVLAAGAGTAWWTWRSLRPPVTAQSPVAQSPIQSPIQSPVSQAPIQQSVQVYWIKNAGNRLELVPAAVAANVPGQPDQLVKAALEAMLKGASAPDLTSTVPQGTSLRQVEIKSDGVHVDLSREFTSGGGSTSMIGRVGQVIYTATTLDPNAPVWISVAGQPLSTLGGEGLILDQPMTRKTFNQNFQL